LILLLYQLQDSVAGTVFYTVQVKGKEISIRKYYRCRWNTTCIFHVMIPVLMGARWKNGALKRQCERLLVI